MKTIDQGFQNTEKMDTRPRRVVVIVPAHNESANLREFLRKVQAELLNLNSYTWEFVFVDDGSKDDTWRIIEEMSREEIDVKGICLSRNFGKEIALTAGVESTEDPDAVILMDADLQHPPSVIPELIRQWELGFQIVITQRKSIRYSLWREIGSSVFYFMLNRFSKLDIQSKATDFRLLDKQVLEVLHTFPERNRFFRGIVDWMGFRKTSVTFDAPDRESGSSAFAFKDLFRLAINSFTSFSLLPLQVTGYLGLSVTTTASLLLLYMVVCHLVLDFTQFTPLAYFVVFNTLLFGIVLAALGMIALYIGNIHTEVVGRPLYIVQNRVGFIKK